MTKPSVLVCINDFTVGGAQRLIAQQLALADVSRYDWHLVTFFEFPDRDTFYHLVPNHVQVHRLKFRSGWDLKGVARFLRLLRSIRPRAMFSHLFYSNAVSRLVATLVPTACVTVEHNVYKNKKRWQIWFDRLLALKSKRVIAVSEEVRQFTIQQQWLTEDRCIVVENGISLDPILEYLQSHTRQQARQEVGLSEDAVLLLAVGRLTVQKDQALLINGFDVYLDRLRSKQKAWKSFQLWIAGEGVLREQLQEQINRLGRRENIRLLGNISDLYPYYLAADAQLSTSRIEGFSIAQLEGLAFGLPLLGTPTGGTGRILRENETGFLIRTRTAAGVAEAIEKWVDADRPALAKAARQMGMSFSIVKTVRSYEALIDEL